jgi:uncharacterized protein YegL
MIKRYRSAGFAVVLFWLMLAGVLPRTPAQTIETLGIDIVFLVDQSGSMSGTPRNPIPTDPQGLRFRSLQYALKTLAQYRAVLPEEKTVRMSVVYFGDSARTVLDWVELDSRSPNWQSLEVSLLTTLAATGENMGNTNFLSAFREAQTLFNLLPTGELNRSRLVVLLTDGAPCAPSEASWVDKNCNAFRDQTVHLDEVLSLVRGSFPSPLYQLYVLALDEKNSYWSNISRSWETIVGGSERAVRILNMQSAAENFLKILSHQVRDSLSTASLAGGEALVGQLLQQENGVYTFDAAPYLQVITINAFKTSANLQPLTIIRPDGVPLSSSNTDVTVFGLNEAIEAWNIRNPLPGRWTISSAAGAGLTVYIDAIAATLEFDAPSTVTRFVPFTATFSMKDALGNVLPPYPNNAFELDLQATLVSPSGANKPINFASNNGTQFVAELLPKEEGLYFVDVRANVRNTSGQWSELFSRPRALSFTSLPVRFDVQGLPTADLLIQQDIAVTATWSNADGEAFLPQGVEVEMNLLSAAGATVISAPLLPQSSTQTYSERLTMEDDGQYRVEVRAFINVDGTRELIGEVRSGLFNVRPTRLLLLSIDTPRDNSEFFALEGTFPFFWTFAPKPLVVETRILDDATGELLLLKDFTQADVVSATLSHAGGTPVPLRFEQDEASRLYSYVWDDPQEGDYTLAVRVDRSAPLNNSAMFAQRTREQQRNLRVVANPAYFASIAVAVLVALTLVGVVVFAVLFTLRRRQHPLRGRIEILNLNGDTPILTLTFDGRNTNYYRLRNSTLESALGIKFLVFRSTSEQMHRNRAARVEIHKKRSKAMKTTNLSPHSEYSLGIDDHNNEYVIRKDWGLGIEDGNF